jgi:hypothetical protein
VGERKHCPSQNPTKGNPSESDLAILEAIPESVIDMDGDEGASEELARQLFSVR